MRRTLTIGILLALAAALLWAQAPPVQFVFTSDSHYGITRPSFRGEHEVNALIVNAALVSAINRLPATRFPQDGGVQEGELTGSFDFVADGGDIANREEQSADSVIQSASVSWTQFQADYLRHLTLHTPQGTNTPVFVVPGNHDVSNAIGYYKVMVPRTDPSSMAGIHNLMMSAGSPIRAETFDYSRDRVLTSRDIGGIHFLFITIWPDSLTRQWIEADLAGVSPSTPVIVFAHDPPDADPKHFTNPNGERDINGADRFENLLNDALADGPGGKGTSDAVPLVERRAWEGFLRKHPNVTAYFHGHNNWTQFYDWTGPDHTVTLHTFRVDSPMKGRFSAADETKLSFEVATIDRTSRTMTVREVLWNSDPAHPDRPLAWGASTTVALAPRLSQR